MRPLSIFTATNRLIYRCPNKIKIKLAILFYFSVFRIMSCDSELVKNKQKLRVTTESWLPQTQLKKNGFKLLSYESRDRVLAALFPSKAVC